MKSLLGVCLIAAGIIGLGVAQDPTKPVLQEGISVKMPVASDAVAMPAADAEDATVITVTAEGKIFLGLQPVEVDALARVPASTVYVKADARAPYQQVLMVLDELQGHSVVLLTAPGVRTEAGKITPPYGVRVAVGGKD
jgi:biopolymer transport protein ExbD/TolR